MYINNTYFNRTLQSNMEKLTGLTQKLSTGKRINTAFDDASGLQISTRMSAQNRGNSQAIRNIQDGISMLETADGSLDTIQNMLQRMRELAIQGNNGTNSTEQKLSIQNEIHSLVDGINKIAINTKFNDLKLLTGKSVGLSGIGAEDQRVRIDNIPVNTSTGAKTTVEFWMYWDGKQGKMPLGWNNDDDIYLNYNSIGINSGSGAILGAPSVGLENKWTHIAVVFFNGLPVPTNSELYINGEKQDIKDMVEGRPTIGNLKVTSTVFIGGYGNTLGYDFGGQIDELKIWDGARTEGQIKNNMYSSPSGNQDGLLGYWKFDDETLRDETSNGNNGQFINGTSLSENGVSRSFSIHSGTQSNNKDNISSFTVSAETINLKNISLEDENLIKKLDNAINAISIQRGGIGAKINRYEFKLNNLHNTINNTEAARMRIEDLDMASAMTELTKGDIQMKTTQQMLKVNNSMHEQKMQMLFN